jgi:Sec-independent protein translocase protein TatA
MMVMIMMMVVVFFLFFPQRVRPASPRLLTMLRSVRSALPSDNRNESWSNGRNGTFSLPLTTHIHKDTHTHIHIHTHTNTH